MTSIFNSSLSNFRSSCNGAEITCSYSDGIIQADPDVAGIGVLIPFILTSIITFAAIILGYFTYSIDDDLTNEIDVIVVRATRRLLRLGDGSAISSEVKAVRKETLTRFVLALSDQQLVTGLAILITAYYRRCTISGYHFSLVAALAWFSSTTHLSTLAVLHPYFMEHPVLKRWRFGGMICLLGLLFYGQMHVLWVVPWSLPIQCTFAAGFPQAVSNNIPLLIYIYSEWFGILTFLFFAYGNNMVRLFAPPPAASILDGVEQLARSAVKLPSLSVDDRISKKRTRLEELSSLNPRTKLQQLGLDIYGWILQESLFQESFQRSFLWEIVWLTFGNVYGLLRIVRTRWTNDQDSIANDLPALDVLQGSVVGSENTINFGQMVPLLLLALPLFAAGEAYYDLKEPDQLPGHTPLAPEATRQRSPEDNSIAQEGAVLHIGLFTTFLLAVLLFFAVEAGYEWGYQLSQIPVLIVGLMVFILLALVVVSISRRIFDFTLAMRERRKISPRLQTPRRGEAAQETQTAQIPLLVQRSPETRTDASQETGGV